MSPVEVPDLGYVPTIPVALHRAVQEWGDRDFIVTPDRDQLRRLAELVDESRLHVAIAATFPLTQGRAAFESGRAAHRRPGKTVVSVRDEGAHDVRP